MALFDFELVTLTLSFTIAFLLINKVISLYKKFRIFQNLPGEKDYSIIYGNLHKVPNHSGEAKLGWITQKMNNDPTCRKLMRHWQGPFLPTVAVYHPDTVRPILKSYLPKGRGFGRGLEFLSRWLGEGLICVNDRSLWQRNRKLLNPAFHAEVLKSYNVIFNSACDVMMEKLTEKADKGETFEISEITSLCVFEGILRCAMGCGEDVQRENSSCLKYVKAVRTLIEGWSARVRNVWMWPDFLFALCPTGRRFNSCLKYVHSFDENIIRNRREHLEKYGTPKDRKLDFVEVLLTSRGDEGEGLTDREIREEVDTFMAAGYDTTATATPWLIYNIAKYPDYQRRVQEELDALTADHDDANTNDENITWQDLSRMPLMSLCAKESNRVFPPVPYVLRVLPEDMVLDGHTIPKDTLVSIFINNLHRHPDVWENPDTYYPERFARDEGRDSFAYIPFSAGQRNCLGQNFALNEMKVITGRILKRFNIELDPKAPPVERSGMLILKPAHGIWVRLTKRTQLDTDSKSS